MKYIFILLIAIPIIYLAIAHTLAVLPTNRFDTTDSLDFDQLDTADLNASIVVPDLRGHGESSS